MEAVIKIKSSELTNELLDNIKRMFGEKATVEIAIRVSDKEPKAYLFEETREEYFQNLREAIDDVENNRNLVRFTAEEFKQYAESLTEK
jgi:hypothetical protein